MNYACAFSQLESGKYFEWIIILLKWKNLILHPTVPIIWLPLFITIFILISFYPCRFPLLLYYINENQSLVQTSVEMFMNTDSHTQQTLIPLISVFLPRFSTLGSTGPIEKVKEDQEGEKRVTLLLDTVTRTLNSQVPVRVNPSPFLR